MSRSQDDQLTAAQQRQLQHFLGRQQQFALRVQQQNERQTSALTPKFRPSLCRKSLEMSAQHFKVGPPGRASRASYPGTSRTPPLVVVSPHTRQGEFLDRVERDVLRRNDAEQKAFTAKDFSCTFQPQLSKKVDKMKARSVYEMSRGDLLRRETSAKMMKLRIEREEMEQLTYQPEISRMGKKVQSSLKLREDPAFFLQHYKGLESGRARRREMERQHRIQQEMENCTFRCVCWPRLDMRLVRGRSLTSRPTNPSFRCVCWPRLDEPLISACTALRGLTSRQRTTPPTHPQPTDARLPGLREAHRPQHAGVWGPYPLYGWTGLDERVNPRVPSRPLVPLVPVSLFAPPFVYPRVSSCLHSRPRTATLLAPQSGPQGEQVGGPVVGVGQKHAQLQVRPVRLGQRRKRARMGSTQQGRKRRVKGAGICIFVHIVSVRPWGRHFAISWRDVKKRV